MPVPNDIQQAIGRVQIAVQRLAGAYPFHASVLERLVIRSRPEVETAGVTVSGDDVLLLINPPFILALPMDQLVGVLLHEVHHVVFRHVLADPADYPDRWACTVAQEVTVNEFITEPLPGGGIRLDHFPALPPMESTDDRYGRLATRRRRPPVVGPRQQQEGRGHGSMPAEGNQAQDEGGRGAFQDDKKRNDNGAGKQNGAARDPEAEPDAEGQQPGGSAACPRSDQNNANVGNKGVSGAPSPQSPEPAAQGTDEKQPRGTNPGPGSPGRSTAQGRSGADDEDGSGGQQDGQGTSTGEGAGQQPGCSGGQAGNAGDQPGQSQGTAGAGSGTQGNDRGKQVGGGKGLGAGVPPSNTAQSDNASATQADGKGQQHGSADERHGGQGKSKGHGKDKRHVLVVLDDHSVWQEAAKDPSRSDAAISAVIQDAVVAVGREGIPGHLLEVLKVCGVGAGDDECELAGNERGSLPWVQLLRRYVGQVLEIRPDFRRPPRRFPHLVGIVPGKRRMGARPRIMAVIDTSGSMTPTLLDLISGELSRLAGDHEVTVVECDYEIQKTYKFKPLLSATGGGGTDLCPPFERPLLRRLRPDLIIYFTDGCGPAPEHGPRIPVIWCLTPLGEQPATWGRVIHMQEPGAGEAEPP